MRAWQALFYIYFSTWKVMKQLKACKLFMRKKKLKKIMVMSEIFSRTILTYKILLQHPDLNKLEKIASAIFVLRMRREPWLLRYSSSYEWNSSIKQLFKLPVGSSTGCKIYEQQYKQTEDGSKRVPEAARRESLAVATQSITFSACHIQPQAIQQRIQNIFPRSYDCSATITT